MLASEHCACSCSIYHLKGFTGGLSEDVEGGIVQRVHLGVRLQTVSIFINIAFQFHGQRLIFLLHTETFFFSSSKTTMAASEESRSKGKASYVKQIKRR